MKLFSIIGHPVLHSKSPILFGNAYPNSGEEFAYFRLASENVSEALQLFRELGISGMNVTAPYKNEVAQLADFCGAEVEAMQASNTVVVENGKLCAYNTDIFGVSGSIENGGVTIAGKRCLVLGAGGAGSAAAYALHSKGGVVTIANRTLEKATQLASRIGCKACSMSEIEQQIAQTDLIVSTLYQDVEVINEAWLKPSHIIFDAIYHNSQLEKKAKKVGCKFIDGAYWLLFQGPPAYRKFTGLDPDFESMKKTLLPQKTPKHVALIGFMGAGKSTVAPLLGKQLGMPVIEADALLEKKCGASIPQIISEKGEAFFREKEREVLEEILASSTPSIISCGGGAATQPELSKLLKENSIVIWIYASPEKCVNRINIETRPLLAKHENPQQAARELFEQRKFLYAKTAWMLVSSNERTPAQVSNFIYEEVSKALHS
jgi:shikimate dehydrogenase